MTGLRVGKVAFAPLPSESGAIVPVAFGTLAWKQLDVHGMSVFIKATFDLTASPMRVVEPDPIATLDIVPRKPLVDVMVSPAAKARAGETTLVIRQRGITLLDVKRSTVKGKSHGLEPVFATAGSADAMQCALVDQRVPVLDADATVHVSGVFEDRPSMTAQLPSARAVGVLFGVNPNGPDHPTILAFKADTVFIDPDAKRLSVVWRAELPLHGPFEMALLTVGGGVATHDYPLRLRKRLRDLEVELRDDAARPDATVLLPQRGPVRAPNPSENRPSAVPESAGGTRILESPVAAPDRRARGVGKTSSKHRAELRTVIAQAPIEPEKALPFDPTKQATAPKRERPITTSEKGATLPMGAAARSTSDKSRTIPFETEKDRKRAAELEAERARDEARRAEGEAKDREAESKRAEEQRIAEERRIEAQRAFEAEQIRLRAVEASRKENAAKVAREQAQKLDEGLYGGFGKKKK